MEFINKHRWLVLAALCVALVIGGAAGALLQGRTHKFNVQTALALDDAGLKQLVYDHVREIELTNGVARPIAVNLLSNGLKATYIVLNLRDATDAAGFEQLVYTQGSDLLPPAIRAFGLFPGTQEEEVLRSALKVKLQMESAMRAANLNGDWSAVQKAYPTNPLSPLAKQWKEISPTTVRYLRKLMAEHPELF